MNQFGVWLTRPSCAPFIRDEGHSLLVMAMVSSTKQRTYSPASVSSLLGTAVASKERLTSLSVTLIQTGCIAPWWCESLSHRGGPVRRPIGLLNHNLSAGCRPPTNAGFVPIALPETCLCFHVQSRWRLLCAATRYGKGTSMKVVVVHEVYFVRSLQSILLSGRG